MVMLFILCFESKHSYIGHEVGKTEIIEENSIMQERGGKKSLRGMLDISLALDVKVAVAGATSDGCATFPLQGDFSSANRAGERTFQI